MERDLPCEQLSEEQRERLLAQCPPHLDDLLQWVGSNPRMLETALGVLIGQNSRNCSGMALGGWLGWV